jgi:DNA-binding MarR family transcriptional regulator
MRRSRPSSKQTRTRRRSQGANPLLPRIDDFVGNKILLLANLVSRSATLRYRRLIGLPQVSWRIIALLGAQPPMTLHELVARAGLDKSQLSRGVSGLVRRQLVSRQPSTNDRRAIHLQLTERGIGAYAILLNGAYQRNEALLAGLSKQRRRLLLDLLDLLTNRARKLLKEEELVARG